MEESIVSSPETSFPQIYFLVSVFKLIGNKYSWSVSLWQFLMTHIFFLSLNFEACYNMAQWGKVRIKNSTLCLHTVSWLFFLIFHQKVWVFIIFIPFFCWSIIRNWKLSVELYVGKIIIAILVSLNCSNQIAFKAVRSFLKSLGKKAIFLFWSDEMYFLISQGARLMCFENRVSNFSLIFVVWALQRILERISTSDYFNPLSANIRKRSNRLKQLPTNCLSMFDQFFFDQG